MNQTVETTLVEKDHEEKMDQLYELLLEAVKTHEFIKQLKGMIEFSEKLYAEQEKAIDDFVEANNLQDYYC